MQSSSKPKYSQRTASWHQNKAISQPWSRKTLGKLSNSKTPIKSTRNKSSNPFRLNNTKPHRHLNLQHPRQTKPWNKSTSKFSNCSQSSSSNLVCKSKSLDTLRGKTIKSKTKWTLTSTIKLKKLKMSKTCTWVKIFSKSSTKMSWQINK